MLYQLLHWIGHHRLKWHNEYEKQFEQNNHSTGDLFHRLWAAEEYADKHGKTYKRTQPDELLLILDRESGEADSAEERVEAYAQATEAEVAGAGAEAAAVGTKAEQGAACDPAPAESPAANTNASGCDTQIKEHEIVDWLRQQANNFSATEDREMFDKLLSHVSQSFDVKQYRADVNTFGMLRQSIHDTGCKYKQLINKALSWEQKLFDFKKQLGMQRANCERDKDDIRAAHYQSPHATSSALGDSLCAHIEGNQSVGSPQHDTLMLLPKLGAPVLLQVQCEQIDKEYVSKMEDLATKCVECEQQRSQAQLEAEQTQNETKGVLNQLLQVLETSIFHRLKAKWLQHIDTSDLPTLSGGYDAVVIPILNQTEYLCWTQILLCTALMARNEDTVFYFLACDSEMNKKAIDILVGTHSLCCDEPRQLNICT